MTSSHRCLSVTQAKTGTSRCNLRDPSPRYRTPRKATPLWTSSQSILVGARCPFTFQSSFLLPVSIPSDDYTHTLRHFNSQPLFTHHHIRSLAQYALYTPFQHHKTNLKLSPYQLQSPIQDVSLHVRSLHRRPRRLRSSGLGLHHSHW
jgi:hypothetical protein